MYKNLEDKPKAWVFYDRELLTLWNYTSGPSGRILDTKKLFLKSAKPHFDFFFKYIDYIGFAENGLESVEDKKYKNVLTLKESLQKKDFTAKISDIDKDKKVLILKSTERSEAVLSENAFQKVEVYEKFKLANTEVLWRKIRKKLQEIRPDIVLVNMGPERAWIIPRITLVLGVEAVDISFLAPDPLPARLTVISKVYSVLKTKLKKLKKI
jgi:hypothetical protein